MCNNNNSESAGSRPDKLSENGFHFEIAPVPAAASFCGGDKCDNNNVTYDSNSNSNSNSQFQALQLKRSSAPTHSRSKSMPRLFKSMSLSVQGSGNKNGSAVLQHQQSLGGQRSGFRCVCCEHVAGKQQKHRERRYSVLWRNWLPLINRKQQQPNNSKAPLVKKPSEKNIRTPQKHAEELAEQHQPGGSPATVVPSSQFPSSNVGAGDYEPDEEAGLELPPPMKPIQEPHLIANGPPAFTKDAKESSANLASTGKMDGNPLSEIEEIVKTTTEQHESNSRVDGSGGAENASTNGHGRSHDNNHEESHSAVPDKAAALKKRQCVFAELVSTEESYVQDLHEIVNGYMSEINNTNSDIPMPEDLKGGKMKLVFNNIKDIYEWHRDFFLRALRNCQKSPADLGPLIKRSATKFALYYTYCSNKPLSEYIVSAHYQYFDCIRQKLGHRLDLSNLIIKPVQRITKYELLIKEIIKATEGAGLYKEVPMLQEAYQQMKVVVKTVNDMMVVLRSLQDFDGEITAQGSLLMQGPMNCVVDAGQKQRELQVFLFQQIIIFADIEKAKNQYSSPTFKYRSHIQLNHMQMKELGDCRFQIKSTDPNKIPEVTMICQAATQESYAGWRDMLNKILQQQNDLIFMLSNPLSTKNK
ncbi:rho guanine nucleotide exchange factor 25 isoform X3 [Drosophila kikkawai]|uniref:Rho guanine nucleotide exchange factor 25 isoform X3 n=1 Tax=Drosophila kikkawai TaxID=30033 RepID=A0A6P4I4Y7_DROKI|nr:rho guanine nucleotide exchange factor 25 isoform X2 [Drosophila kikkawai]